MNYRGGAKTRATKRKEKEQYKNKQLMASIRKGVTLKKRPKTPTPSPPRAAKKTRRKRKVKCWSRRTKQNKHYVVCSGSRGQKRRRSRRLRKQRGGLGSSLFPQELVNTGRNISFNIESGYNAALGKNPPVNPDPAIQPINNSNNLVNYRNSDFPKYYNLSQKKV